MYDEYGPVFSAMTDYIALFGNSGCDRTAAEHVFRLLAELDRTPMSDIFAVSGADEAARCAVALGALVCFSRRAAETVSAVFGVRPGSITPEAVCELFYGVSDIFPLIGSLTDRSAVGRVFDGVEPRYNAVMTMKPFAARFISEGELDDDAFLPASDYDINLLELTENERAVRDTAAALRTRGRSARRIIALYGEEGSGRRTAAVRALTEAGLSYAELRAEAYGSEEMKDLATKLFLLDAVPIVVPGDSGAEVFTRFVRALAEETGTVVAICGGEHRCIAGWEETVSLKIDLPTIDEQYRIWENEIRAYKTDGSVDISELAGEFSFTVGGIKRALRCAEMFAQSETLSAADIKNGCCRSVNSDMGSKAVKINCVFGWDDIVLPEHSKKLMKTACDQVRYRHKVYDTWGFSGKIAYGKSVSMIFTGPPGTGKTMAAQIIAGELGLDIYRISLANVVSKYIGETEKNLDEIFEKAKKSKVVLFFDEADVLFSKRTEVKDSNDKYSNMESAFLLQKIEEYNGIVILATNLVQNFDEAFKRRMKLMIDFPFPDKARRAEMWRRAFPDKLPLGDIDFEYLVNEFELSGSNIKNIALHSAFLAAAEGSSEVGMKHIIAALRNEYSKSGKAFTKAEAGEYFYYIDE